MVFSPSAVIAEVTPLFFALSIMNALLNDVSVVSRDAAEPISRKTIFLLLNVVSTPSVPLSAPSKKASTSDEGLNNKLMPELSVKFESDSASPEVSTFSWT